MTKELINSAAETIHSENKLSITKGILSAVVAEARKEETEGIEKAYELLGKGLSLSTAYCKQLHILMERLKEQG